MTKLLIVDDEASTRRLLTMLLTEEGYEIREADGYRSAVALLSSELFDVVLTDQRMPDGSGVDLIDVCKRTSPYTPLILVTSFASIELAVSAMRQGAFDFITKPFECDTIKVAVGRASRHGALVRENAILRSEARRNEYGKSELLGSSKEMTHVRDTLSRVAPTNSTVLIQGETGTGKELVARLIHKASNRAAAAFVPVNCAAMPEPLLEGQLFGHEKGAFTGAAEAKEGLFEAVHGGTLFLDEIGEMPLSLQAKLLRVLMDGEVLRIGSNTPRHVDVRLIIATHRDLEKMVKEGQFRQDLYYRIAVVPLFIPPLRERKTDVPELVDHYLSTVPARLNMMPKRVAPEVIEALTEYDFPGNVRELHNLLERAMILGRSDEIGRGDLPLACNAEAVSTETGPLLPTGDMNLREYLEQTESAIIEKMLAACGGNQAEAARRLATSRSDMNYKVKKFGLK